MHEIFDFSIGLNHVIYDYERNRQYTHAFYDRYDTFTFQEASNDEKTWGFIVNILEICQTRIKSLEFSTCQTPSDYFLDKLLTFPKLTKMCFTGGSVSHRFFSGLISGTKRDLQLRLHAWSFTEGHTVGRFTNVKELEIGALSSTTLGILFQTIGVAVDSIHFMARGLDLLVTLRGPSPTEAVLVSLTNESFSTTCPMLKTLKIEGLESVVSMPLYSILLRSPLLDCLNIDAKHAYFPETRFDIKKILWVRPRLREINLKMMTTDGPFIWSSSSSAYKAAMGIIALATPREIKRFRNGNNLRKFPPEMLMCVYDCLV